MAVAVQATQVVLAGSERRDEPGAIEYLRGVQILLLARHHRKLRQHIAHRAELVLRIATSVGAEGLFDGRGRQRGKAPLEVVGHLGHDVQGLLVANVMVGVE